MVSKGKDTGKCYFCNIGKHKIYEEGIYCAGYGAGGDIGPGR